MHVDELPVVDSEDEMGAIASDMKRVAGYGGIYRGYVRGPEDQKYLNRCKRFVPTDPITSILFTRDGGMHDCGWWKNPDYNNCLHLSLSFVARESDDGGKTFARHPKHSGLTEAWCRLFFGDWTRFIWAEPPFTDHGKEFDVWHYRVFTSPDWKVPILPRGEVYSRELTEAGWKSWSDLHGDTERMGEFGGEIKL